MVIDTEPVGHIHNDFVIFEYLRVKGRVSRSDVERDLGRKYAGRLSRVCNLGRGEIISEKKRVYGINGKSRETTYILGEDGERVLENWKAEHEEDAEILESSVS